jgi:hypothetical protein
LPLRRCHQSANGPSRRDGLTLFVTPDLFPNVAIRPQRFAAPLGILDRKFKPKGVEDEKDFA